MKRIEFITMTGLRVTQRPEAGPYVEMVGSDAHIPSITAYHRLSQVILELDSLTGALLAPYQSELHRQYANLADPILVAGIDPECDIAREEFSKLIAAMEAHPAREQLTALAHAADIQFILSSLHQRAADAVASIVQLYESTSSVSVYSEQPDAVISASGPGPDAAVRACTLFFVVAQSCLDMFAKAAIELQELPGRPAGTPYRRLRSNSALFGNLPQTLRDATVLDAVEHYRPAFRQIETLRHSLVHDIAWSFPARVYLRIRDGLPIERWLNIPDHDVNGVLVGERGRRRFFSQDRRAAELLPQLAQSLFTGIAVPLELIAIALRDSLGASDRRDTA